MERVFIFDLLWNSVTKSQLSADDRVPPIFLYETQVNKHDNQSDSRNIQDKPKINGPKINSDRG